MKHWVQFSRERAVTGTGTFPLSPKLIKSTRKKLTTVQDCISVPRLLCLLVCLFVSRISSRSLLQNVRACGHTSGLVRRRQGIKRKYGTIRTQPVSLNWWVLRLTSVRLKSDYGFSSILLFFPLMSLSSAPLPRTLHYD